MAHIAGFGRDQLLLLPEAVDDYVEADNSVRFIDVFVDGLDLAAAGFGRVEAKATGRPGYAPGDLLKLYIYGYLIRLSPDDDVLGGLHIAEGIETALTGMSKGLRPMWAVGSTSMMTKFPVLPGIEALTIVADNDDNGAGERACEACAARWHAAGREVFIIQPTIGKDLNDAIRLI